MSIRTYWYKRSGNGNFGDELGPWIIEKLSGKKVTYVPLLELENNRLQSFKSIIKKFWIGEYQLKNIFKFHEWISIFNKDVIISVGSIISWYKYKRVVVWGSGLMNSDDHITNGSFYAVRGPYTQNQLMKQGYKAPAIQGDPGLLLNLLYEVENTKEVEIGVIPHVFHYDYLKTNIKNSNVKIINLLDSVENVIQEINSCCFTVSTSLHGIIVSHSYGIPSLWVKITECEMKLNGDDIKFKDYFLSVNIAEYNSINISIKEIANSERLMNKINPIFSELGLPPLAVLNRIKCDLIANAPFKVLSQYKNIEL